MNVKNLAKVGVALAFGGMSYAAYNAFQDAKNYKSVSDYKKEILQKDPKRYNLLINKSFGERPFDFKDWQYEAKIMNDSIKTDSLVKKAYFEGAQMVRDSISHIKK